VIAPLTGVRAFAALWVVLFHLRIGPARALPLPGWLDGLCQVGYLGVDLFGFLSGFVIAHNYAERLASADVARVGRYLWIRAVRLVPLHWLALAILLAARIAVNGFDAPLDALYGAGDFVQQLLLVHGFGLNHLSWNQPSWTVSSEWLCYLLFPLAAAPLARLHRGDVAALLAVAAILATIAAMHAVGRPGFDAAAEAGVLRIAGEFATGCLLQRAWAAGFARRAPWGALGPAALAAAVLGYEWRSAAAMISSFALLVYALAQQRGWLARVLATAPIVFVGEASYAIYVFHYVVMRMFVNLAPSADGKASFARVGAELAAIVAVAIAAHLLVEDPARRRLRRWVAPV